MSAVHSEMEVGHTTYLCLCTLYIVYVICSAGIFDLYLCTHDYNKWARVLPLRPSKSRTGTSDNIELSTTHTHTPLLTNRHIECEEHYSDKILNRRSYRRI